MPVPEEDTGRKQYAEITDRIKGLDINKLTPMEALFILNELKEKLADDKYSEQGNNR